MSNKYKEIGEILAAARRDQKKSLKDASEITKIMEHYLTAIEAGEPEQLPSEAYFQLFARSYAQYLGIDPALFDEIEEKASVKPKDLDEETVVELTDTEKVEAVSRAHARKFGRSLIYLAVIVFIVFIGFIVYNMFFVEGNQSESRDEQAAMETHQGQAEDETGADIYNIAETPYQPPGKLKLHLIAKQDVWAVVVRDGDTVLNRRLEAGNQRIWEADYRYHVTVGISTAVDLYVNDLKLAPLSDQARTVAGLEINQVNYKDFLPKPEDTLTAQPLEEPAAQSVEKPPVASPPPQPQNDTTTRVPGGNKVDTISRDSIDGI